MNPVIRLPDNFVPINYPGYFWNTEDRWLYSIKIGGELRRLQIARKIRLSNGVILSEGFEISCRGKRKRIPLIFLLKLKPIVKDHIIQINGQYSC